MGVFVSSVHTHPVVFVSATLEKEKGPGHLGRRGNSFYLSEEAAFFFFLEGG